MAAPGITYTRIVPRQRVDGWADSIAARVHDPLWQLSRQREVGEYRGENASTPVWVTLSLRHRPLASTLGDPVVADPSRVPAEALVETDPDDWWTMGRRIRVGRQAAALLDSVPDDAVFAHPPAPYEGFVGEPDGLLLWRRRDELALPDAAFAGVPVESPTPSWVDRDLLYDRADGDPGFVADGVGLRTRRHRGGPMDWYSVDGEPSDVEAPAAEAQQVETAPAVVTYPGARVAGHFTFEDPATDLGAAAPDGAHPITALMTEAVHGVRQEWFGVPVLGRAGSILSIDAVTVVDSFDRTYTSATAAGLRAPEDWTLFRTDGLGVDDLVLWQVAETPLQGAAVERVELGVDEESNLVWAVERVLDGRAPLTSDPLPEPPPPRINSGPPRGDLIGGRPYAYLPGVGGAPHWIPYTLDEAGNLLVQRRLVDLSREIPTLFPPPAARVLRAAEQPHRLHPSAVPDHGLELERRWILARDTTGRPVLWCRRRRAPRLAPPARRLRFDVTEPLTES